VREFLLRLVITALALWAAVQLVTGIAFDGPPLALLGVALVFGVVNAVLKPLLTVLTCPLILLTLGLFTLVLNAILLLATAHLAQALGLDFTVAGFWPAFWGGLLIGLASTVLTALTRDRRDMAVRH
jgi:putative membrane protein